MSLDAISYALAQKAKKLPTGAYSYIIYKDGNMYFAVNGQTGNIEYSDTDYDTLKDSVVSSMTTGLIIDKVDGKDIIEYYKNGHKISSVGVDGLIFLGSKNMLPYKDYMLYDARYVEQIDGFEDASTWSASDATATDYTSDFKEGNQCIKVTSSNNLYSYIVKGISIKAKGKHFEIWVYVEDVDTLSYLQMLLREGPSWTNAFSYTFSGVLDGWNKFVISRGDFTKLGSASDWDNITAVRLVSRAQTGKTLNVLWDDFRMVRDRFPGVVSIRFDDNHVSVHDIARPYMDKYGFRGIVALPTSYVGLSGKMTLSQLKRLQERGWDIISHTVNHINLTTITIDEAREELFESQRWLIENGFIKGARFFAPPQNGRNDEVMAAIREYYVGCQTMKGTYGSIPPADKHYLSLKEVDSSTSLATVEGWIDTAIEYNAWLTIVFHDLVSSGASGNEWLISDFESLIDYIASKKVPVVTISDVFDNTMGLTPSDILRYNSGTAIFSGDGSTTSFNIAHGLATTPTKVRVSPASPDAEGCYADPADADATNIVVKFKTAPPSGTDNVKISWEAEV